MVPLEHSTSPLSEPAHHSTCSETLLQWGLEEMLQQRRLQQQVGGAVLAEQQREVNCDHPHHGGIAVNTKFWVNKKIPAPCQTAVDLLGQGGVRFQKHLVLAHNKCHPAQPRGVCRKSQQWVFTYHPLSQETMRERKHRKLHIKCQNML